MKEIYPEFNIVRFNAFLCPHADSMGIEHYCEMDLPCIGCELLQARIYQNKIPTHTFVEERRLSCNSSTASVKESSLRQLSLWEHFTDSSSSGDL